MILGIDVHVVFGIQDNVGADIAIDIVAESADLVNKLISPLGNRTIILHIHEQGKYHRKTNDNTENSDDEHRTRTDEPDDHVQRELCMPGLADVQT